jgi:glycosyltransferase involved in cell wall biosynthesis
MTLARVGLDARATRQMSIGMKTYARELVARLPSVAPEYAYVSFSDGGNFGWAEQVRLPLAMRRARVDVVHFLSQYVPVVLPRRFIITIHDLIHLRFPQYFKTKVGPYYRTVVRYACARAMRVITDDVRTVDDLEEFLGVDRAKVRVIPLGVAENFLAPIAPHTAERPFVLYVGNHREHKDLRTLFEAWSSLAARWNVDLYVTGPDDFGGELQRRSTPSRAIVALGEVPDDRLASYYAGARALIQPALREGFGLPMLEAMAAGCPVIACRDAVPAPLEEAARAFPARDSAALRLELDRMLSDEGLRSLVINKGVEVARRLSWDRCARATADVYREVLEQP